jgi:hypothetical protein
MNSTNSLTLLLEPNELNELNELFKLRFTLLLSERVRL